jgi:hypothetical protein
VLSECVDHLGDLRDADVAVGGERKRDDLEHFIPRPIGCFYSNSEQKMSAGRARQSSLAQSNPFVKGLWWMHTLNFAYVSYFFRFLLKSREMAVASRSVRMMPCVLQQ